MEWRQEMQSKIINFVDFEKVNMLLEGFNQATGFVTAILDIEGNVLSQSGWRHICTEFHRVNSETAQNCRVSDTVLANQMKSGEKYHAYKCFNGLVDVAVPIIIKGEHIANLFSGQFFFEEPDVSFFKKQANQYGFDETSYLKALEKVPVVSEEKVEDVMQFLINIILMISELTLEKLEQHNREQRYRGLIDNLGAGVVVHGPDSQIILSNHQASKLLGLTEDQMRGKKATDPAWQFIKEDMTPLPLEAYPVNYIVTHKTPLKNQVLGICHPNSKNIVWVTINGFPFFDVEGKLTEVVISFIDITERQLAEKAIAEEKEQLAVTLRSIGDGVITTDIEGKVLIMNRVAEKLTGWSQDEAMGMPITTIFNIINESTRLTHENPVQKVLTTGGIIELANHTLLISKDGSERAIADSGAPIRDKGSEIIGVVLVFRDMTEKQKLLSNMQRIDKLDSLGILAGGIAHDFNNLLGGIFGYIDMARMASEDCERATQYLDKALSVFDRAKDLTQQLLTFSKGGVPKRRTGQLGLFIKDTVTFVLSGSNVNSEFIIAKDLWLCDFDENQIGQVIDNMLINAMQAMPLGGTVTIVANNKYLSDEEAITIPSGKYIEITIKDEGAGISQETLKSIFDPFFSTKQKGNGLGLATCYSIIQKHDGYIEVESEIGKGSSFHIYLPASENAEGIDDITIVRGHKGFGTILIIDDEDFMREILAKMLIRMGYQVLLAVNGEEALEESALIKSQGDSIRAAIFDLTIPGGMGGKETIKGFKDIFPDTPVFVSSGFSEDLTIARPRDFGFTDSIRKPYKEHELGEMLEKYLPH